MTKDGDTEITTFNDAPVDGVFIVGFTTWSSSVSETNKACVQGCGGVAFYSKKKETWMSRWIYVNTRAVLEV
jgi:hypothetical protein